MSETQKPTVTYTTAGDYLLPDLILTEAPLEQAESLGNYGLMRKAFLKQHRPSNYNTLLLAEELYPHCWEIEQTAQQRMEQIMQHLMNNSILPDKSSDPISWTAAVNSLKAQAEEMVLQEIIFTR